MTMKAQLAALVLVASAACATTPSAPGHPTRQASTEPSVVASNVHSAALPVASTNISVHSMAPSVSMPADGYFMCVSKDIAICTDRGGEASPKVLATGEFVDAPTLSIASRTVYYFQQMQSNPPGMAAVDTIQRVSLDGGPSTTIATAPPIAGDEGVGLGAPQASPDGRYVAYVLTVGVLQPPSSPGPTHALVLPSPVGAQIFIVKVGKPSGGPLAVPMAMTGANTPDGFNGYTLIGWAPDDSRLYYYGGPGRDLEALSFDAAGQPTGVQTVVRGASTAHGCPDGTPTAVMTPSGDVLFTSYCSQQPLTMYRVHDGSASIFAALPQLTGTWLTQELIVDTTGRRVQLDAMPWSTDCVSGEATITFLDGDVIDQQIETDHHGCPPGTPASP